MFPAFGERRTINLGGNSGSKDSIKEARALRAAREQQRREREAANTLQATYRAHLEKRRVQAQLKGQFFAEPTGLNGLRCAVLVADEDVLGRWSSSMNPESLLGPIQGRFRESWLVLVKRASFLLLRSVGRAPESSNAVAHLSVLSLLLSQEATTRVLGETDGSLVSFQITSYLLNRGLYALLASAISSIPVLKKAIEPSLPLIFPLIALPLSTFNGYPQRRALAVAQIITSILTLPVLPNRIPAASLTSFFSSLPFDTLYTAEQALEGSFPALAHIDRVALIANLVALTPLRYTKLTGPNMSTYLQLMASAMDGLPVNALDPPPPSSSAAPTPLALAAYEDSDSDEESVTMVSVVSSFTKAPPPPPLLALDSRTTKRMQILVSPDHITALVNASLSHPGARLPLVKFLLALGTVWPARREGMLRTVVLSTNGGLVRELYRTSVRGSELGREADSISLMMSPKHANLWPPLLFLADLYTQSLLTMGDDEFFSSTHATSVKGAAAAPRNPLTLDDLSSLSRTLLNIAFALFWRDDQLNVQEAGVPGMKMKWVEARERVTKCLVAIHDRDSRRPFTSPDHWLVSNRLDIHSFIEAAVLEDMQASELANATPSSRALSKRQIALMSPRLGVLNNIPFAIPFEVRVAIFRSFVGQDMVARGQGGGRHSFDRSNRTRVRVRRSHVAQDCFDGLSSADLKGPIEIQFIDQFGEQEAGIDGGGIFKEALTSLVKEVFDTDRGLWLHTAQQQIYPNPTHSLNWYRFIGRILGKAMYEGILVDVQFASFFLAKWLGKQSFLDDLSSLDPELYAGLIFLKRFTGNFEDLALNFTVTVDDFGTTQERNLVPNGSTTAVTQQNRLQYIQLMAHYRLTRQIKRQSEAFFEGLSDMIEPKWLRMFDQREVQILLGGANSPVDLEDLRANTVYGGLYDDSHIVIQTFWSVSLKHTKYLAGGPFADMIHRFVDAFDRDQRRLLLRFVTSCSRPPLLGFKEMYPKFAIRDAGPDQARLPTSSTCVNLLKLPPYQSPAILRAKLLQAISAEAGFDLS